LHNELLKKTFNFSCTFSKRLSGVRGPNFTKLDKDMERSWLHNKFVSEIRYLAAFLNADGSELNDLRVLKTTPNFTLFDPCEN